jgi:pilus assembly protein CpaD
MIHATKNLLRATALVATVLGAACSAPVNGPEVGFADGARNHPILVEPSYQSIKLFYSPADRGLTPVDAARLENFVDDYRAHGNGSIAISAPAGVNASLPLNYLTQRINEMGVSRDKIMVSSHDTPTGDLRIEINFVSYLARTDECGDWSEDVSKVFNNSTAANFGCSVQQNIAAMVADPRDLMGPREMDMGNAARRATVIGKYQQGLVTQAEKRSSEMPNEQSGYSSTVGQ